MLRKLYLLPFVALLALEPLSAMHIMEGYLPLNWCAFWYVISLPCIYLSYRYVKELIRQDDKQRITFALNVAFIFILSALKLPSVTGSSSHLTGTGLGTLTSGVRAMPLVGLIVLLFQAILLAHGGISTLGANVFSLAIAGPLVAYAIYSLLSRIGLGNMLSIGIATFFGSMATYTTTSLQLAVVFPDALGGVWGSFTKFLAIFAITQVPLAIVEAMITVAVIRLIGRMSSEQQFIPKLETSHRAVWSLNLGAVICLALPLLAGYMDFGEGTDDAAGQLTESLHPSFIPKSLFSLFEPSDALEPWLFVLQVLLGIALFAWAYKAFRRLRS